MFSGWGILSATSAEQLGVTELIANKFGIEHTKLLQMAITWTFD
jgi:hypothetical protein